MYKFALVVFVFLSVEVSFSQNWIDTSFEISSVYDVLYGISTDFKGADYYAEMDISFPTNDDSPECGRPLMVIVHGGAWYSGDKSDSNPTSLRKDFAKRGYTTASINYRQGMFNTNLSVNCNLDGWNCWNMTDTSEWYRANYRAIQDVRGAVRYLVNEKDTYNINPDNIFLVGESAGGFVVLGAGFTDDPSEVLEELVGAFEDAPAPNSLYENDCIQQSGLANNIEEMDLSRPHLGSIEGELNVPVLCGYRIRGVGSFYGGVFNNIFETHLENSPALYLFHQPCDLIVPFNHNKLLAGYNSCAVGFPTYCQNIVNRPFTYGSNAITSLIDDFSAISIPTCEYLFDNGGDTYSCLEQVVNPTLACHAIDNYWLRSNNMATFFADEIADCSISSSELLSSNQKSIQVYPNPVKTQLIISLPERNNNIRVRLIDVFGREVYNSIVDANSNRYLINTSTLNNGIYGVLIEFEDQILTHSIMKI